MIYTIESKIVHIGVPDDTCFFEISYYDKSQEKQIVKFCFDRKNEANKLFLSKLVNYFGVSDIRYLICVKIAYININDRMIWGFKHPQKDKFLIIFEPFNEIHEFSEKELEEFIPEAIRRYDEKINNN